MPNIAGHWNGNVFGTNTGNLHLEVTQNGEAIQGTLRFADHQFGINVYAIQGTATDDGIEFDLTPSQIPEGLEAGPGTVTATIAADGSLQGSWQTTIGSAGTFRAYRHLASDPTTLEPLQLFNRSLSIGAVRMYRRGVENLIDVLRKDFVSGRPVVTYLRDGNEISEYADTFLSRSDAPEELQNLKITIQELEPNGMYNMSASAEFYRSGGNIVRTSGTNESWVLGKCSSLFAEAKRSEKRLASTYLTHGLKVNLLIMLALLVALPELELANRALFAVAVVLLLWALSTVHGRVIPSTLVRMASVRPNWFVRTWDQALSWVLTVASAFAASWLFWYLIERGQQ